jgi:hypothetical protein
MSNYVDCMAGKMRSFPKGLSREERGKLFCIEAKLCSGKFSNRSAAEKDCLEHPAAPRTGHGRRGIDSGGIAQCLYPRLTAGGFSQKELTAWISECSGKSGGIKIKKPETKNHFIKVCAMEGMINGSFAESVKLRKACEQKWKEKEETTDVQT